MGRIWDSIMESITGMRDGVRDALPDIVSAVIILVLGWLLARFIQEVVLRLLRAANFGTVSEKAGVDKFLATGGVKSTGTDVMARLVYWLVMLVVLVAALNVLGLTVATELMTQILLYVPNLIVAAVILAVGLYVADFTATIVRTALANAGVAEAPLVASGTRLALTLFTLAMALTQLKIASQVVANAFLILMGAVGLGLALAFGLGARDIVARYLEERTAKGKGGGASRPPAF